jgi:hypothetical protein
MKRLSGLILTFSIVFFLTQSLYSAEVPQVQEGAKSVFWGFNGLADLSVNNSVIGGQYNIADRIGIFATLGLDMFSNNRTPNGEKKEDLTSSSDFNFSIGAKLYLFKNDPVSFFVAPTISIMSYSFENVASPTKHIDSKSEFGVGIGVGAEWWFTTNVSFSASTTLGLVSHSESSERGDAKAETSYSHFGTMKSVSVFTLAFYF